MRESSPPYLRYALGYLLALCSLVVISTKLAFAQNAEQQKIALALFVDHGANAHSHLRDILTHAPGIRTTIIDGANVRNGCLQKFDVIFVPGGSGKREAFSLGEEGRSEIRRFVEKGGIYVGVCAGCYLASCTHPEYLGLLPIKTVDKEHWRRGKATLPIQFTSLGGQIFSPNQLKTNVVYHNGPVFSANHLKEKGIIPLSYYCGDVTARGGISGMMYGAPAMVLGTYGNGLVLGISPHPEATPGLDQIEINAIHWLYNYHRSKKQANRLNIPAVQKSTNSKALSLSQRIYNKAEEIFTQSTSSHYEHLHEGADEQVQQYGNYYCVNTDCSGFVSYVIKAVAPKHYSIISSRTGLSHPHAKTYASYFRQLEPNISNNGWLRIESFRNLQQGDIIAWQKPQEDSKHKKGNGSGHVMIVVDPPSTITEKEISRHLLKFVEVYVIDSSSVEHFPPQSLPPLAHQLHRDGLGKGMVRLILDDNNNVIGYWEGTYSNEKEKTIKGPTYTDKIGFARLVSYN